MEKRSGWRCLVAALLLISLRASAVEDEDIGDRFSLVGVIATGSAESGTGIVVVRDRQKDQSITLKAGQIVPDSGGMWISKIQRNSVQVSNGHTEGTIRYGGAEVKEGEGPRTIVMSGEYYEDGYAADEGAWRTDGYAGEVNYYEEDAADREALLEELRKRYTVFEPVDPARQAVTSAKEYVEGDDRTRYVQTAESQPTRPLKYPHIVPSAPPTKDAALPVEGDTSDRDEDARVNTMEPPQNEVEGSADDYENDY